MLRLPIQAIGSAEYAPFQVGDNLRAWCKGEYAVVSITASEVESGWEKGEGSIDELLPIREDLLRGDLRALYLGWLVGVQYENVDDNRMEPPVPPGLRDLSGPLSSLAEFLEIDAALIEVAAEVSDDLELAAPSSEMLCDWIAALPVHEKNSLLLKVASGDDGCVGINLMRRFELEFAKPAPAATAPSRTAGELLAAADRRGAENAIRDEARRQLEQEREAKRLAEERARYPDALEPRSAELWNEIDALIANTKRPTDYKRAVTALTDPRDLASRKDGAAIFQERLRDLCARHTSKRALLRRIKAAGLES